MQTASYRLPAPPRHLSPGQLGQLTPSPRRAPRHVTIALDAFPEWHVTLPEPCQTEADYWASKVPEHIKVLQTALLLHKQITSGITVPRSLSYALNAMQVEAARRIRTALRRHVTNGGLLEAELRQAWEQAA